MNESTPNLPRKTQVSKPFITIGFREDGEICAHIDTESMNGMSTSYLGQLLAGITRGLSEIIRLNNNLHIAQNEQIETEIANAYMQDIGDGPAPEERVEKLDQ